MSKVKISNLRNIASLEFDVPTNGVYVLTGSNGSGKTSLLLALNRICRHYPINCVNDNVKEKSIVKFKD